MAFNLFVAWEARDARESIWVHCSLTISPFLKNVCRFRELGYLLPILMYFRALPISKESINVRKFKLGEWLQESSSFEWYRARYPHEFRGEWIVLKIPDSLTMPVVDSHFLNQPNPCHMHATTGCHSSWYLAADWCPTPVQKCLDPHHIFVLLLDDAQGWSLTPPCCLAGIPVKSLNGVCYQHKRGVDSTLHSVLLLIYQVSRVKGSFNLFCWSLYCRDLFTPV